MSTPVITKDRLLRKSHGTPTNNEKLSIRDALVADVFFCGRGTQSIETGDGGRDLDREIRALVHNANYSFIKLAQIVAKLGTTHPEITRIIDKAAINGLARAGEKVAGESDAHLHLLADVCLFVSMTKDLDLNAYSHAEMIDLVLQRFHGRDYGWRNK